MSYGYSPPAGGRQADKIPRLLNAYNELDRFLNVV